MNVICFIACDFQDASIFCDQMSTGRPGNGRNVTTPPRPSHTPDPRRQVSCLISYR
ncbi:hypothetical protein HYDPIDRAFT_104511 [Hydnomerulius pinastri MD-312]|nr:hypothetical protein HYDPIDRAFT_104511 [Hydnomerulius pinastri MD-312]